MDTELQPPCSLPGDSLSAARGGAGAAHPRGPEGGCTIRQQQQGSKQSVAKVRWRLQLPLPVPSEGRLSSANAFLSCRGRPLPAPSRPPRLRPLPCAARGGRSGPASERAPELDDPRAHFRVPPPAAAIGQWAARRGCRELCWIRPPAPRPGAVQCLCKFGCPTWM